VDHLVAAFRRFAERECHGSSPLYEALARATATDPELLKLSPAAPTRQPAPNLLVLGGVPDRLSKFYPSVVANPQPAEAAFPAFRAFCLDHRRAIERLLETRRVQPTRWAVAPISISPSPASPP